jgi:WYL domain
VRLLFEPKLAVYVAERDQKLKQRADGRVEMRLETTGRKELVRWVLSWIPDVKVLAPKSLRDRIVEKLQDGLRRRTKQAGRTRRYTRTASKLAVGEQYRTLIFDRVRVNLTRALSSRRSQSLRHPGGNAHKDGSAAQSGCIRHRFHGDAREPARPPQR